MVKVYFESNSHAELVAKFDNEETYNACFPMLEKKAERAGMIVTETVDECELDAKKELEAYGYYTENLWSVEDVKNKFTCSDDEAQEVLDGVMQSDYIMEQINVAIQEEGEANELPEKEEE